MARRSFLIFLILILFSPISKIEAEATNVGLIPGNIWYSKDPFEERDKIKIYTLVFNSDERELSGVISFFDKDVLLGKKNFKVAGASSKDLSIDWTATAGKHVIKATIEDTKFFISTGEYEDVYLTNRETIPSRRTVSKEIALTKQVEVKKETPENESNDVKIQNFILDTTPTFITEPVLKIIDKLESWREEKLTSSENKAKEMKVYKIWQLFLQSIIVFYGTILIIVFCVIRYLLNKIL
ncbi:hypothetical protein HZA26_03440 [Candidatus Nomurabacteria bacterium]|nr:hypothetical protein [Candidatus Nomurabacteria bacterium]